VTELVHSARPVGESSPVVVVRGLFDTAATSITSHMLALAQR